MPVSRSASSPASSLPGLFSCPRGALCGSTLFALWWSFSARASSVIGTCRCHARKRCSAGGERLTRSTSVTMSTARVWQREKPRSPLVCNLLNQDAVGWWCCGRGVDEMCLSISHHEHALNCAATSKLATTSECPHLTTKLHQMTERKNGHVGTSVEMKRRHEPDKATIQVRKDARKLQYETRPRARDPPQNQSQEARTPIDTGSEGEVTDTLATGDQWKDGSKPQGPRDHQSVRPP